MADQSLPPQSRKLAMYAAGGGFGGALLAIVIAKILTGSCCCGHEHPQLEQRQPLSVSAVTDMRHLL